MEGLPFSSAKVYLSRLTPGDPWAAVFIGFGRKEHRLQWEYRYLSMPGGRLGGDYTEWDLVPEDEDDEPPLSEKWELEFLWMTISEVARGVSARLLNEEHDGPERAPGFFEISDVTEVAGSFRIELGECEEPARCRRALAKLREEARIDAVREAIATALFSEGEADAAIGDAFPGPGASVSEASGSDGTSGGERTRA